MPWIFTKGAIRLGEVVGQQKVPPFAFRARCQLRHQACPSLMNKTIRGALRQSCATHGNVILQVERPQNCRRYVSDATEDTRHMVIAEDRRRIAAAGAQLVFGYLVGAGSFATSGLDLFGSASLRQ